MDSEHDCEYFAAIFRSVERFQQTGVSPCSLWHCNLTTLNTAGSIPFEREDQLASQEIVGAQDQRSSSIEV
jgi:hypothetical protein